MANLPGDVWLAIGTSYLSQRERICLSQACRQMQKLIQPIIFQTVVFCGASDWATHSVRNLFTHVVYLQERIEFLQENPRLNSYIRHIRIIRWLNVPLFWTLHFLRSLPRSTRDPLRAKLQSLWLDTSRSLFGLVASLPFCTKISLMELESVKWSEAALLPGPAKHEVLEALHIWRCKTLELEFSVPETKEKEHFSELRYIFQEENLADQWKPVAEEYFRDILSAWTLPITKTSMNLRMMSDLPISIHNRLHSLKGFGVAEEESRLLSDTHLEPLKLSQDLKELSIFAKDLSVNCLGSKENLETVTFLSGNAKIVSKLLHLCPNATSLYIEETVWSYIKEFISPKMTQNIYELDLGPLLDAGTVNAEIATYFPKLRRFTVFRLSKIPLMRNVNIAPSLQDLFKETLDLCMEFKELEVLWLLFPYKPLAGPKRPVYSTQTVLNTGDCPTHRIKEIILGPQGNCVPDISSNSWIYEPYMEAAYQDYMEVSYALDTVIQELNDYIPSNKLIELELLSAEDMPSKNTKDDGALAQAINSLVQTATRRSSLKRRSTP